MNHSRKISRRFFVWSIAGTAGFTLLGKSFSRGRAIVDRTTGGSGMPTRPLGNTGCNVSLLGLGGQATLEDGQKRDLAIEIINRAIDLGVNYVDTANLYGRGASESCIGDVLRTRRKEVFLATKTHDRSYDGSMRLLEQSLKRLQTDHIDLWQLHNIQTHNDVDFILSRDGAAHALERARDEGIVRFTGITGHKDPLVLKRAIEQHPFDTILMALNAADRHSASFIDHLLPVAVARGMGILAMKVPSRGKMFHTGGITTMEQAMRYVLTLPVSSAVIGISTLDELEENTRIAQTFTPCSPEMMAHLEELTRSYFSDALWYRDHM